MNIFRLFCFSLAKIRSRSQLKKSAPAPAKKPWLRPAPAPQHWSRGSADETINLGWSIESEEGQIKWGRRRQSVEDKRKSVGAENVDKRR